jgi:hypothetical protein
LSLFYSKSPISHVSKVLHWNQIFLAWIALILQELLMKDIKN